MWFGSDFGDRVELVPARYSRAESRKTELILIYAGLDAHSSCGCAFLPLSQIAVSRHRVSLGLLHLEIPLRLMGTSLFKFDRRFMCTAF